MNEPDSVVVPGAVGSPGHEAAEAARDVELLRWVARFRFVTAELTAARFGVSWQRANARLRRLEHEGLVKRIRLRTGAPLVVHVTGRGFELLGQSRRKAPRVDIQREHELAIVAMTGELDRRDRLSRVLTERECRALDRPEDRYCTDVRGQTRRYQHGWPDLVIDQPGRRIAIEIELSAKSRARLERILDGYARGRPFDQVHYVVASPALARYLIRLYDQCRLDAYDRDLFGLADPARLRVLPLPGLPTRIADAIRQADASPAPVRERGHRSR